jgi:hypothetical protein
MVLVGKSAQAVPADSFVPHMLQVTRRISHATALIQVNERLAEEQ